MLDTLEFPQYLAHHRLVRAPLYSISSYSVDLPGGMNLSLCFCFAS